MLLYLCCCCEEEKNKTRKVFTHRIVHKKNNIILKKCLLIFRINIYLYIEKRWNKIIMIINFCNIQEDITFIISISLRSACA